MKDPWLFAPELGLVPCKFYGPTAAAAKPSGPSQTHAGAAVSSPFGRKVSMLRFASGAAVREAGAGLVAELPWRQRARLTRKGERLFYVPRERERERCPVWLLQLEPVASRA